LGGRYFDMLNLFKRIRRMNTPAGIYSSDAFRVALERERARAERTGQMFSLVLFRIQNGNGNERALLEHLGKVLVQKVRISDEIGWYDENRVGTLLPGTSAEGAWQFVDIVKKRIGYEESFLNCSVYSYPFQWISSDVSEEESREDQIPSHGKSSTNIETNFSAMMAGLKKSVKPLGILFARPIPYWKQAVDAVGSLLLLTVLSPVFLLISLVIKIVSPGPVFYRQERIGHMGKRFTFWKFRTMHVNNDETGHKKYLSQLIESDAPMKKLDDGRDNRIIPFGKLLRSSCLDELPQLINVLLGDMSLVGPRPCLPYEAEKYLQWHARRFDTVPGMTGLWQVSGKNRLTFKEMIRLDIRYSREMSPWLDAKILLLTGPAILGMLCEPLARKARTGQAGAAVSPSRREGSVRGVIP